MSHRAVAWLAWSSWALSVAFVAAGLLLATLAGIFLPQGDLNPGSWEVAFVSAAFATVGTLVATRRPSNLIGWIFCGVGLVYGVQGFTWGYATYGFYARTDSLPAAEAMAWVSSWFWIMGLVSMATFVFLLFPHGRLPSRRWRPVVWLTVGSIVMIALGKAFRPGPLEGYPMVENPLGISNARETLGSIESLGAILAAIVMFTAGISLILRVRRLGIVERQQLKWFVYAASLLALIIAGLLIFRAWDESLFSSWFSILRILPTFVFAGVPIAVGVAILRYRLYDIDVIVNRTLVYGALTVSLALVYFGGVTATQAMFRALTGQQEQPQLAVVVSTLVIAALFNPLRRRIQGFIDRRFYRRKYDARKTLEAFSHKLRDETDLARLGDDLLGVVRETMHPAHVSLWLRPDPSLRITERPE